MGLLNKKIGDYIIDESNHIIKLKLVNEFPLSVWQTGSGTHTNMNANEVISNFIIKKLKGKLLEVNIQYIQMIMLIYLNHLMIHFLL